MVTRDVPDYAVVVGNPAKVAGYVCECGIKLEFKKDKAKCSACGAVYSMNGSKVERRD